MSTPRRVMLTAAIFAAIAGSLALRHPPGDPPDARPAPSAGTTALP